MGEVRGRRIGPYALIAELARGGMGTVFLALSPGGARASNKLLVVKALTADPAENVDALAMFREEARLAARLNHPGVVQTHDMGSDGDQHYLVMDFLDGVPLSRLARRAGPLPLDVTLFVVTRVLEALEYAHNLVTHDVKSAGIVHRDVSPSNVFVTFEGHVKLVDFGVAKALKDSNLETRAGVLKGKPTYMAPEQVRGQATPRVDVFAVGAILWELVAGRRMWSGLGELEVLSNLVRGDVPSLREAAPNAPEELVRIVNRALAWRAEDRYASAEAFAVDLDAFARTQKAKARPERLATLMTRTFTAERQALQTAIAEAIAAHASPMAQESLPKLPGQELGSGASDELRARAPLASASAPSGSPGSGATPLAASLHVYNAPRRDLRWLGAVVAVALLAAVAGVVVATRMPSEPVHAVATATTAHAGDVKAPDVDSAPRKHDLRVTVEPRGASVEIDGKAVANPYSGECAHDANVIIKVTAPGYDGREREVVCSSTQTLELVLNKTPVPVYVNRASPPPPVRPPPRPTATTGLEDLGGTDMGRASTPRPTVTLDPISPNDVKPR